MKEVIGVIGGNVASKEFLMISEEVGREIARAGAVLVCGGRSGIMEAACKGAKKEGGLTIGILPGDCRGEANPYVDIPIVTGMGIGRNIIVVRSSQAIIAIDGKYGTLSEISFALQLHIPVIGIKTWEIAEKIVICESAREAVRLALQKIRE